jgi:DNA repair exonuclease SbcCD ATPase subunit
MTATFGRLDRQTLDVHEGLNIIHAPNEAGKSTWCAFLTAMLYGINSRERDRTGFLAEKNRFAPWSGSAMQGRLDCRWGGRELTLFRETRRQGAPLGDFRAVYAGTGETVPALTAANCGEQLLGVSREVFERSAFIRQAGLPISQDAGLERRIAALITTGEEDTSYSEASQALKKQLNRRRHNKTGQLPALEAELQELQAQQAALQELTEQLTQTQGEIRRLEQEKEQLAAQLRACARQESARQFQAAEQLRQEAMQARQRADALAEQLRREQIPENDTIGRLRGAIVNLETVRKSVEKARAERDQAMKAQLRAEAAVGEGPFAGRTPEQVRRELSSLPAGNPSYAAAAVLAVCGIVGAVVAAWALWSLGPLPALGLAGAILIAAAGGAYALSRAARRKAREAALLKRYGTADTAAIADMADTYYKLYEALEAARAEANAKTATADALYTSLSSNEQGILLEVRRFAPTAFDIPTADRLLRSCAVRRRELTQAEQQAREAQLRWELQRQQLPEEPEPSEEAVFAAPEADAAALTARLAAVEQELASARSSADRLSGRITAEGDPAALSAREEELRRQIQVLEGEYDAIALALEALERANTTLQTRFSPALGRRTAEIFSRLTGGRYTGVVLDRSFHFSAEPAGDPVYRDAGYLSAGAADQLYLAARLAICELVLPKEQEIPLILDDALANFDDARARAALDFLKEEARERQVLLFTCHSREGAWLRDDPSVHVLELTDSVSGI